MIIFLKRIYILWMFGFNMNDVQPTVVSHPDHSWAKNVQKKHKVQHKAVCAIEKKNLVKLKCFANIVFFQITHKMHVSDLGSDGLT